MKYLAGRLGQTFKVVQLGRHFLQSLYDLLSKFRRKDQKIRLNTSFQSD